MTELGHTAGNDGSARPILARLSCELQSDQLPSDRIRDFRVIADTPEDTLTSQYVCRNVALEARGVSTCSLFDQAHVGIPVLTAERFRHLNTRGPCKDWCGEQDEYSSYDSSHGRIVMAKVLFASGTKGESHG